ncbi:DUF3027 domain-containing protein [Marisediminicola senii]|uniref:DUF3027 domain-containing protein n=1 Tax=Marisediminicola senii TaxID=2711233 RepID=UPI0022A7E112|nr:DUF3027 domain-containing protein [Marisediminicola senii]
MTTEDLAIARAALEEITPVETIGVPQGFIDEGDGVISVYFDALMAGYPGWRWTASIAHVDGFAPSVLETELTPGDTAILSPAWVPWVDRLAEYQIAQEEDAADDEDDESSDGDDDSDEDESDDEDDESDDDDDDDDESDDDDDSDDAPSLLHAGDLDGVDIDVLVDPDAADDESTDPDDEAIVTEVAETAADDAGEPAVLEDAPAASAAPLGVDETENAESDTDGAGDEPPALSGVDEESTKEQ